MIAYLDFEAVEECFEPGEFDVFSSVVQELLSILGYLTFSGGCGCGIASLWVEWEVNDEFVEPDDWALALSFFLEEDDA